MTIDETQEPTLRYGEQAPDGWVEYLQQLLNSWASATGRPLLTADGIFGPITEEAVFVFQESNGLMVDGIVGNQTWARLRGETPQDPGTDGTNGGFVEIGLEARWWLDTTHNVVYDADQDEMLIWAFNTGSEPLDDSTFTYECYVTTYDQGVSSLTGQLSSEGGNAIAAPGEAFFVRFRDVARTCGTGTAAVQATMAQELGGDLLDARIELPASEA